MISSSFSSGAVWWLWQAQANCVSTCYWDRGQWKQLGWEILSFGSIDPDGVLLLAWFNNRKVESWFTQALCWCTDQAACQSRAPTWPKDTLLTDFFHLENMFIMVSDSHEPHLDWTLKMSLSGDILQASDDLSHVINSYKKIVKGQTLNGESEEAQQPRTSVQQGTFLMSRTAQ